MERFRFLDFEAVKETFAYASYLWLVQGLENPTSKVIEQFRRIWIFVIRI
jgi:hypothetical protein